MNGSQIMLKMDNLSLGVNLSSSFFIRIFAVRKTKNRQTIICAKCKIRQETSENVVIQNIHDLQKDTAMDVERKKNLQIFRN